MHYPRAFIISAITYLLTLGIGLIAMVVLGGKTISELYPPSQDMIQMSLILAVIFTGGSAAVYFHPDTIQASAMYGLKFGLVAFVTGLAMDGLLAVALLVQGKAPADVFMVAYNLVWFIPTVVAAVLICTFVGYKMGQLQISMPRR